MHKLRGIMLQNIKIMADAHSLVHQPCKKAFLYFINVAECALIHG